MIRTKVSLLATALLGIGAAHAQSSLGELLDQGARKLTAAEVQALGDVRVLRQREDADAYITMRADGTVVGMVHNKQGHGSSEAVGTWQVDDSGRRCSVVDMPAFRMQVTQCGYAYRLGGNIWLAPSDSDRAAMVAQLAGPAYLRY